MGGRKGGENRERDDVVFSFPSPSPHSSSTLLYERPARGTSLVNAPPPRLMELLETRDKERGGGVDSFALVLPFLVFLILPSGLVRPSRSTTPSALASTLSLDERHTRLTSRQEKGERSCSPRPPELANQSEGTSEGRLPDLVVPLRALPLLSPFCHTRPRSLSSDFADLWFPRFVCVCRSSIPVPRGRVLR